MKKLQLFYLLNLLMLLVGCGGLGDQAKYVTGAITIPVVISIDSSDGIIQLPFETEGDKEAIEWESSDSTVASIDEEGFITVHKNGQVNITATSGTHTATSRIITTVGQYTDYIKIYSKTEFLVIFSNPDNFADPTKKYALATDIDFGGSTIEPIGGWDVSENEESIDPATAFRATLDGRGYALMNFTISNPYMTNVSGSYFGVSLFPFIYDGIVRNLNIIDATFSGTGFTGSIAGKITHGIIENCFVRASIISTSGNGGIPAGGIAGIIGLDAIIRNVILDVNVSGGFIYSGFNFGTGINCNAISETLDDAGRPNPIRTTAITTHKDNPEEDAALKDFVDSVRIENDQLGNMNSYMLTEQVKQNLWAIAEGYMPFLIRADGMTPEWAKIQ